MDEYWDSEDQWCDRSRCMVCGDAMGYSLESICSATCSDVMSLNTQLTEGAQWR